MKACSLCKGFLRCGTKEDNPLGSLSGRSPSGVHVGHCEFDPAKRRGAQGGWRSGAKPRGRAFDPDLPSQACAAAQRGRESDICVGEKLGDLSKNELK